MRRLLTCLTCLPGLLLAMMVATVTTEIAAADEPTVEKRYEVEVIVFRHVDQSRNTPETPAASAEFNASPLDLILTEPLTPAPQMLAAPIAMADTAENRPDRRPPITFLIMELKQTWPDFAPLPADTQVLNRVYQRLERLDAYEPILHTGWVQPAHNNASAKPYRLTPTIVDDTGITGAVTLYKERFLHLKVNLALDTAILANETAYLSPADVHEAPDEYTLMESRRIRGSTLHYFDHPQFGIIARVQETAAATAKREETG